MRLGIRMPVRPLLRSHRPDPALMVRQLVAWRIDGRLAALRRPAYEAADVGLLGPELAAGIRCVIRSPASW